MNSEWTEERFVDTGTEWSADEIETYQRWCQRNDDYHSLLNFTHICQMINISRDKYPHFLELNKRLEEKWDVLTELPPYITHAWEWSSVHEWIQKIIESDIANAERLEEISSNVYGKWQIMLAREEFEENTKNALQAQEKSFVNWADWNKEQIQEYRESNDFASDYTFLINLYLKMKTNLEFSENADEKVFLELSKELEENFDSLMNVPVYALDKTFKWNSLYSVFYRLSEKLPEDQRTVVDSLTFLFDQYWDFQHNNNI